MAKCKITQTMLYNSPGTLVFWYQRSQQNCNGVTTNREARQRWELVFDQSNGAISNDLE